MSTALDATTTRAGAIYPKGHYRVGLWWDRPAYGAFEPTMLRHSEWPYRTIPAMSAYEAWEHID